MDHHAFIFGFIAGAFAVVALWSICDYRRYKRTRKDVTRVEGYLPPVGSLAWSTSAKSPPRIVVLPKLGMSGGRLVPIPESRE